MLEVALDSGGLFLGGVWVPLQCLDVEGGLGENWPQQI